MGIIEKIRKHELILCFVLFALTFVATRAAYYGLVNIPYVFDDTPVYVSSAYQVSQGTLDFKGLGPAYPLFLLLCKQFSNDIKIVTYFQSLMTLVIGVVVIQLFHRTNRALTFPATAALVIFTSSLLFVHFETSILTECLFSHSILLFIATLVYAVHSQTARSLVYNGLAIAFVLAVRPAGLFVLPIYVLCGVLFTTRKIGWKKIAMYASTPIAFLLSMSLLNFSRTGAFNSSSQGAPAIASISLTFMQPDVRFPQHLNKLITDYIIPNIEPAEIEFIRTSNDVQKVQALYLKYQHLHYKFHEVLLEVNGNNQSKYAADLGLLSSAMYERYPADYKRYFEIQFMHYFNSFHHKKTSSYPFFESFERCFRDARLQNFMYNEMNKTGYVAQQPLFTISTYTPTEIERKSQDVEKNIIAKANASYFAWHHVLFRNHYWTALLAISSVVTLFNLWRARLHSELALSTLLLILSTISYMVVVSVNVAMIRYNQPMHIVTYLVPLLTIASVLGTFRSSPKVK